MENCPFQTNIGEELSCLFGIPGKHRTTQEICRQCFVNTLPSNPDVLNICHYLNLRISISIRDKRLLSKAHCIKKGTTPDCSKCKDAVPVAIKGGVSVGPMDIMAHAFLTKKEKLYEKLVEELEVGSMIPRCFITGGSCSKRIEVERNTIFIALADTPTAENAYKYGILPALENLGLRPLRAKGKKLNIDFMCKICGLIQQSEYVLADLSGGRVNVGYELGIAHGLGKETFVIRDKESAEVSDLKRNEMILYDDYEQLQDEFIQMFSDTTGRLTTS